MPIFQLDVVITHIDKLKPSLWYALLFIPSASASVRTHQSCLLAGPVPRGVTNGVTNTPSSQLVQPLQQGPTSCSPPRPGSWKDPLFEREQLAMQKEGLSIDQIAKLCPRCKRWDKEGNILCSGYLSTSNCPLVGNTFLASKCVPCLLSCICHLAYFAFTPLPIYHASMCAGCAHASCAKVQHWLESPSSQA